MLHNGIELELLEQVVPSPAEAGTGADPAAHPSSGTRHATKGSSGPAVPSGPRCMCDYVYAEDDTGLHAKVDVWNVGRRGVRRVQSATNGISGTDTKVGREEG